MTSSARRCAYLIVGGLLGSCISACTLNKPPYEYGADGRVKYVSRTKAKLVSEPSIAHNDRPWAAPSDNVALAKKFGVDVSGEYAQDDYSRGVREKIFTRTDEFVEERFDELRQAATQHVEKVRFRIRLNSAGGIEDFRFVEQDTQASMRFQDGIKNVVLGCSPFGPVPEGLLQEDEAVVFQLEIVGIYE